MMLISLCAIALAQPPAEIESDRIREEIKAKWGVLMKDPQTKKEMKITQTVYRTGFIDSLTRRAIQTEHDFLNQKGQTEPSVIKIAKRKPERYTIQSRLLISGNDISLESVGSMYDNMKGVVLPRKEEVRILNGKCEELSQIGLERAIVQIEQDKFVTVFQRIFESETCLTLFGSDPRITKNSPLSTMEFTQSNKFILGSIVRHKKNVDRYIFSEESEFSITHHSFQNGPTSYIYDANFRKEGKYTVPVSWSVKILEGDQLIQSRDTKVDSFAIIEDDKRIQSLTAPVDSLVIERTDGQESYSRVNSSGKLIPISKQQRNATIEELTSQSIFQNIAHYIVWAIVFTSIILFYWFRRKVLRK